MWDLRQSNTDSVADSHVLDSTACSATASFFVGSGNDTEDPVIDCPAVNAVYDNTFGICGFLVEDTSFDPVSVTDNCSFTISHNYGGWAVETSLQGAVFPVGLHTVVWTATDASGNTATCFFEFDSSRRFWIDMLVAHH